MKYLFFVSVCFAGLLACSRSNDMVQSVNPTMQSSPASIKIDTIFDYNISSPNSNLMKSIFDLPLLDGVINPNISVYFRMRNPLSGWIKLPIPFAGMFVMTG